MQALQEASPHTHPLVLSPRTLADALQDILRVGCAADVESEALQLVDSLQARLRKVAGQVAKAKRPRVLSLEGLEPLVLGTPPCSIDMTTRQCSSCACLCLADCACTVATMI